MTLHCVGARGKPKDGVMVVSLFKKSLYLSRDFKDEDDVVCVLQKLMTSHIACPQKPRIATTQQEFLLNYGTRRTTIERLRSTFPSTFNCPYDNHFEQNTARPRVACVYFTGLVRTSTYRSENSLSFLRHATKHPISDFAQELTTFTETRDCLLWRHTTFNTSVKCALKSFNQLSVFECPVTRITQYIETELLANGPTVQWRKGSDEKDIPLYNRPTDRLCDWVLGKLRLIWSNFCVKKIICSGRVEETTASVKLYSPSRIYGHLCPDMEDEGTREFALQQLNSPPEVSDRGSFKFIVQFTHSPMLTRLAKRLRVRNSKRGFVRLALLMIAGKVKELYSTF
ncbi:hypothetical protein CLF_101207 [Clonorchis sinensis]|uniref:Uncharacterized protein n=1 Tax=Clonorchis sinensis TaxID=79923 RepID=G7Y5A2_CLOSI|nr:hypothetical protein CLF_101207 [Clonorchis sinensis]